MAKKTNGSIGPDTTKNRETFAHAFLWQVVVFLAESLNANTETLWNALKVQVGFGFTSAGKNGKSRCKGLAPEVWSNALGLRQYTCRLTDSADDIYTGIMHAVCHILSGDSGHGSGFIAYASLLGFSEAAPQKFTAGPNLAKNTALLVSRTVQAVGFELPHAGTVIPPKDATSGFTLKLECAFEGCDTVARQTANEFFGGKDATIPRYSLKCGNHAKPIDMVPSRDLLERSNVPARLQAVLNTLYGKAEAAA